jgi:protease II
MEDYEACILECRKQLGIPAHQTVIYGRSAGGYLVGSCMNRYANGSIFGGVYAEVPFVDVLTGMANLHLPLTEMEADEFGDLRRKPQDFQTVVRLSPIHNLPTGGIPKIFLVARTGLRDRQVFSYEPVKWITRLQKLEAGKKAEPKLLGITGGEGHFVLTINGLKEQAQDLALFLAWSDRHKKSHPRIYNMRGGNKQTRKNQQQQQQQQGGKRKGRKGTRKARKSSKTQRRRR